MQKCRDMCYHGDYTTMKAQVEMNTGYGYEQASLVAQLVKNPSAVQETSV